MGPARQLPHDGHPAVPRRLLADDGWKKNVTERLAEDRTITGAEQEKWLLDGFKNSTQRWDILGQQVFFAEQDRNAAPEIDDVFMDGWDGNASSRRRITQGWVDVKVRATPSSITLRRRAWP